MASRWTEEENEYLRANWSSAPIEEILSAVKRDYHNVVTKAWKLGLKRRKSLTKKERRNRYSATYNRLKAEGICTQCRKRPVWRPNAITCETCRQRYNKIGTIWRERMRVERRCRTCGGHNEKYTYRCNRCQKNHNTKYRKYRRRVRRDVLKAYGGRCTCCKERRDEFLTLDHIYGRKHEFYKGIPDSKAHDLYTALRAKHYPYGFTVLCMNCNYSKGVYGYCPHGKEPKQLKRGRVKISLSS